MTGTLIFVFSIKIMAFIGCLNQSITACKALRIFNGILSLQNPPVYASLLL